MLSLFVLIFLVSLVSLPLSLIKPGLFAKFYDSNRKKNALIFGSLLVISFILIGILAPKEPTVSSTKTENTIAQPTTAITSKPLDTNSETISEAPTPTSTATPTQTPTPTVRQMPTIIKAAPSATPTVAVFIPTAAPIQNQQIQSGGFSCDCGKTCTQISSCTEAQYQLINCGCGARDGDGDGIACDSAPLHCQN